MTVADEVDAEADVEMDVEMGVRVTEAAAMAEAAMVGTARAETDPVDADAVGAGASRVVVAAQAVRATAEFNLWLKNSTERQGSCTLPPFLR